MLREIKNQYLAICWSIFVLVMSNLPLGSTGSGFFFEGFDKLVHTGFFFVLTVLLFYGRIKQQLSYQYRLITVFKILLITTVLGGGIELIQWKIFTYRSAEWWDFASDIIGVGMGIFSYMLLHRIRFNEKI